MDNRIKELKSEYEMYVYKWKEIGQTSEIKPSFNITGYTEEAPDDLYFLESNWNCPLMSWVHKLLDGESHEINNVEVINTWSNQDYYSMINVNGDNIYLVKRYKHRGRIEEFVDLGTMKNITLEDYFYIKERMGV